MRRFTRLTNAFSNKIANHTAAVALHYMYYNFLRIHQTLRVTPAMEAGVADQIWLIEEVVGLLNEKATTSVLSSTGTTTCSLLCPSPYLW